MTRMLFRIAATALVALLAACAARQGPPAGDLDQALAWYDRVIRDAPDPEAVERALAEEVFYLSYLGAGGTDGRLPEAYLAAIEGLTLRLQRRNGRSPWLAQAWYHVGEARRLGGDLDGALAAYENALAIPCSGATGVYSLLAMERIEAVSGALEGRPAPLPVERRGCPPAPLPLEFPPAE